MMKNGKFEIPLLLTATVNPNGMVGASFSREERTKMYIEAIRFYMEFKSPLKIVFAENSYSINVIKNTFEENDSVEWLDVSGMEYDQSRGKGYNETIMIKKAIECSSFIQKAGCFFKITGRLKVLNIDKMLKECMKLNLAFCADCKDHKVYELLRLPINGHSGECRYWFAKISFFNEIMWKYLERLNDYGEHKYLAEDAMLAVCRSIRKMAECKDRFRTQARLSGYGGHRLGNGKGFFYSTDNDSLALKFKRTLRQLFRWALPFWRC